MVSNRILADMLYEYDKGGKFKDFIDKACQSNGSSVEEECQKAIVHEYYLSVTTGCNKE